MKVKGRVAWVTGAASGIGLSVTKHLVLQGAKVVMVDLVDESKGKAIAKEVSS